MSNDQWPKLPTFSDYHEAKFDWARAWKAKAKDLRPWAHDYKVHLSRAATAEIEASEIRARHDALRQAIDSLGPKDFRSRAAYRAVRAALAAGEKEGG